MTTDRQIAANRANSKKSTGPRTTGGKAASSSNSLRHGLTAAPKQDEVVAWYRVILDDPMATWDPFEQDPYFRAAADLARAEARLQRVRCEQERWLEGPDPSLSPAQVELKKLRKELVEAAAEIGTQPKVRKIWDRTGLRLLGRIMKMQDRERNRRSKEYENKGPTLARYRASAEAQRRTALARWIEQITKRTQTLAANASAADLPHQN